MNDFIAYHSAKVMGREYIAPKDKRFHWWSGKSEVFLRSAIGCRVWTISSRQDGRRTIYSLAGVFTPSEIQPESDGYAILGDGTLFHPPFDVTKQPWFSDLRLEQTNFSFGFGRIRDDRIVVELQQLLTAYEQKAMAQHSDRLQTYRTDPYSAAEVFNYLLPDSLIRQQCVQAMADSVRIANNASNTWSITLFQDKVRLNVGKIEVLTYIQNKVHCVIDSECIPSALRQREDVELNIKTGGVYPSVPVSAFCDFSADLAGELFQLLRSSHHSLIRAASGVRGTPFRAAYSPGVTEFLSSATGQPLQHPTHYIGSGHPVISSELVEGALRRVFLNVYERNSDARQRCIECYGCRCSVCDFDFERTYGSLGSGFIHVHHLKPLSEIRAAYVIDPITDLCPICPNCHAMIHRAAETMTIEELRKKFTEVKVTVSKSSSEENAAKQ